MDKWPKMHRPIGEYKRMWSGFSPVMKTAFRKFFRKGGRTVKAFDPRTLKALYKRGILMPIEKGSVSPNYRGCELMDYLRVTKQVTRDNKLQPR